MDYQKAISIFSLILTLSGWHTPGLANDLNDGMNWNDISNSDSIKKDTNVCFIKRNALAKAKKRGSTKSSKSTDGDIVQGGVMIKEGSIVEGPIYVIYQGDNNTVVGGK